jgi:uncharacterized protein (DUF3084 family)
MTNISELLVSSEEERRLKQEKATQLLSELSNQVKHLVKELENLKETEQQTNEVTALLEP